MYTIIKQCTQYLLLIYKIEFMYVYQINMIILCSFFLFLGSEMFLAFMIYYDKTNKLMPTV